jgi:putative phage-type endonuclease
MLTDEQRILRQSGIGGSDVGILLGYNKYSTPLDLYLKKTTTLQPEDLSDNESIYWGNSFEPNIARRYQELTGHVVLASDTCRHPTYPFILATPDGLIEGMKKGLEIKTVGKRARASQWIDNKIPKSYFMQIQHCMFVLDYDEWDLAALFEGQELKIYNFKRDKAFDQIIIEACSKFWNEHVVPLIPPPIDFDSHFALDAVRKLYNKVDPTQIELDDETVNWIKIWKEAKQQVKKHEAAVRVAQTHLLDKMGNNNMGIDSKGGMLIRKEINAKEYTVEPKTYITLTYKGKK